MIDYNITTATLGISTTACIFWLIRKYSIYIRYTVWWVFICAAVLVFSIFPQLSDILVHSLGISYAPAFFFLAAILMLFVKTLFMDIDRSKQEVRIRRLIQRVAMLEAKLEKHRSEAGNTTGK